MIVGVVGHERAKFTAETEAEARRRIRALLSRPGVTGAVSGACHLGGVDIWAREIAGELGLPFQEFAPAKRTWAGGYRERNLEIAKASDEVWCVVVAKLPEGYRGMRFKGCYHCDRERDGVAAHVKSGGCWTVRRALRLGRRGGWVVIE